MPISQLFAMVTMPPNSTIRTGSRTIPKSTPATATATAQPTSCHLRWKRSAQAIAPSAPSGVVKAIAIV